MGEALTHYPYLDSDGRHGIIGKVFMVIACIVGTEKRGFCHPDGGVSFWGIDF
ncbi:MAG: hypothetical protein LBS93_01810 [Synergistaceae bacterium]|jgi:hypothetical protein|nr:hypothetical protein [Synergistaceae bacterium]